MVRERGIMLRKFAIIGSIILIGGLALFNWALSDQKKEEQLLASYEAHIKENMSKLDKLVAGETDVNPSVDIVPDDSLQRELDKVKSRKEMRELSVTISILCMLLGGLLFTSWLWVQINRIIDKLKKFTVHVIAHFKAGKPANDHNQAEKPVGEAPRQPEPDTLPEESPKASTSLGQQNHRESGLCRKAEPAKNCSAPQQDNTWPFRARNNAKKVSVLLADEKSADSKDTSVAVAERPQLSAKGLKHSPESAAKAALLEADEELYEEESPQTDDSLKAQMESLETQVAEFKEMTQVVQQTATDSSEPISSTLMELTQQVSAIREYASQQQDRVKKLQDGYDWNIIRNFCLRVIRCIDNLETRISRLAEKDIDTLCLEEVRDELLFSLESSGVEQFEPEINSDYRGQEKIAEAAKEKQHSDEPDMAGKIATVLRPGYQYFIDEENIKVVRAAQVKLYG